MKPTIDIQTLDLTVAFVSMIIPIAFFLYFGMKKTIVSVLIAVGRMAIQLFLVAVYLEWIFNINSAIINSLWVFVMIWVGVFTAIKRIGLNWKFFVIPMFISALTSVLIVDAFFLGVVIKLDYFFDARYFIPVTGMILGNSLNHNIVGLTSYFNGLSEKSELYYFILTNSGDTKLARRPFIADAVKKGLNPMIAMMSVVGLITLPGMMTGQILGGSSPVVAIKYQVIIMLAIFTGCTINLFLSILFSDKFAFDSRNRLKEEVFRS